MIAATISEGATNAAAFGASVRMSLVGSSVNVQSVAAGALATAGWFSGNPNTKVN